MRSPTDELLERGQVAETLFNRSRGRFLLRHCLKSFLAELDQRVRNSLRYSGSAFDCPPAVSTREIRFDGSSAILSRSARRMTHNDGSGGWCRALKLTLETPG